MDVSPPSSWPVQQIYSGTWKEAPIGMSTASSILEACPVPWALCCNTPITAGIEDGPNGFRHSNMGAFPVASGTDNGSSGGGSGCSGDGEFPPC